jgi:hypothetical protein
MYAMMRAQEDAVRPISPDRQPAGIAQPLAMSGIKDSTMALDDSGPLARMLYCDITFERYGHSGANVPHVLPCGHTMSRKALEMVRSACCSPSNDDAAR